MRILIPLLLINTFLFSQQLVVDGDFNDSALADSADALSFTTSYTYVPASNGSIYNAGVGACVDGDLLLRFADAGSGNGEGHFSIYNEGLCQNWWYLAATDDGTSHMSDHTTGAGNFMIVDGATSQGQVLWSQQVTVESSTNYEFSAWIALATESTNSPAQLSLRVDGVEVARETVGAYGVWNKVQGQWTSGWPVPVTLSIVDINTSSTGNDFAIDDVSFLGPESVIEDSCQDSYTQVDSTVCNSMVSYDGQAVWNESGIYKDTLVTLEGCDSIIEVDLQVNSPVWGAQNVSRCGLFKSATGKTYSTSGTYVDTVAAENGCPFYLTTHLSIESPTLASVVQVDLLTGDTLVLGPHTVTEDGAYPVSYFNKWGCDSLVMYQVQFNPVICTDTSFISVDDTLMINLLITGGMNFEELNISVYPNPTNDILHIDLNNSSVTSGYTYELTNSMGQFILGGALNQQQQYLDMSEFSNSGLYFLTILDSESNTKTVRKIIRE